MNFFNLENPFWVFMTRVADFAILSTLWLICSLPIVTIGASTSALYYCMLKIVRDQDSGMFRMFFHSFKQNLKQGCILTIILLAITAFLALDLYICINADGTLFTIIEIVLFGAIGLLTVIAIYVFPVLAQFDNTTKNIVINAFIMGVANLKRTLIMIIITAIPIIAVLLFGFYIFVTLPIWAFGGIALFAFIKAKFLVKIFDKYIEAQTQGVQAQEAEAQE